MVYDYFDKYTFMCEMYDEELDEIRKYVLNFFPFDNSVQVVDTEKEKVLLRRVQLPPLKLEMLQIGNIINVYSKLLQITDCAPATRRTIFKNVESTFALIKPVPESEHGTILTYIMKKGFRIVQMKNGRVNKDFAMELYKHIAGNNMLPLVPLNTILSGYEYESTANSPFGSQIPSAKRGRLTSAGYYGPDNTVSGSHLWQLMKKKKLHYSTYSFLRPVDYVTTGTVIGLELEAENAVPNWRTCLGATDPREAEPGTLRHTFGTSKLKNTAHGCNTREDAIEMIELYFGSKNGIPNVPLSATFKECTCCVVKPHAVIEGNLGAILEHITKSGKFIVTAMAMFTVKVSNALEFYEIYKGVLSEYEGMAIHLAEGKCVAMEIKSTDPKMINPVCAFRKLCGPRDPEVSRQLYPDSIRALYGKDIVHNAVHCTDLPEEGELEVEYFFKLLANDK